MGFRGVLCCLGPEPKHVDEEPFCPSKNDEENTDLKAGVIITASFASAKRGGTVSTSDGCSRVTDDAIQACYGSSTPCQLTTASCSEGAASTSYLPPNHNAAEEWDALGACMFIAQDMEVAVDSVLDGSNKSAQALLGRYDMDLDGRLRKQDYYDLLLELNLSLPYEDYKAFIDNTFAVADADRDGLLSLEEFTPMYKTIAASRRAFKRQDHHNNGNIDRYDFEQVLLDLDGGLGLGLVQPEAVRPGQLQETVDAAFGLVDRGNRGIINFGHMLLWLSQLLLDLDKKARQDSREQEAGREDS